MSQLPSKCPPLGPTVRATIDRVIDGDTLVVVIRDTIVKIRLLDTWAPEKGTPEGEAATEVMQNLAPVGAACRVHIPTEDARNLEAIITFGRFLGGVWMEGDDDSLNHHMVSLGHATREKP